MSSVVVLSLGGSLVGLVGVWAVETIQRSLRFDLAAASTTLLLPVPEALATEAASEEASVADTEAKADSEVVASEVVLHEVTSAVVADMAAIEVGMEVIGAASVVGEVVSDTNPMVASATPQTPLQLDHAHLEVGMAEDLAEIEVVEAGTKPMAVATAVVTENVALLAAIWSLLALETETGDLTAEVIEVAIAREIVTVGTTTPSGIPHENANTTVMGTTRGANEGTEVTPTVQDGRQCIY